MLQAFRITQEDISARVERIVEDVEEPVLHFSLQVDQYIAADDQILTRERRVAQDIMIREEHTIANLVLDLVVLTFAKEEALQPLGRDIGFDGCGVESLAGLSDRALIQIGCKDLKMRMDIQPICRLEEKHRKSI